MLVHFLFPPAPYIFFVSPPLTTTIRVSPPRSYAQPKNDAFFCSVFNLFAYRGAWHAGVIGYRRAKSHDGYRRTVNPEERGYRTPEYRSSSAERIADAALGLTPRIRDAQLQTHAGVMSNGDRRNNVFPPIRHVIPPNLRCSSPRRNFGVPGLAPNPRCATAGRTGVSRAVMTGPVVIRRLEFASPTRVPNLRTFPFGKPKFPTVSQKSPFGCSISFTVFSACA